MKNSAPKINPTHYIITDYDIATMQQKSRKLTYSEYQAIKHGLPSSIKVTPVYE